MAADGLPWGSFKFRPSPRGEAGLYTTYSRESALLLAVFRHRNVGAPPCNIERSGGRTDTEGGPIDARGLDAGKAGVMHATYHLYVHI